MKTACGYCKSPWSRRRSLLDMSGAVRLEAQPGRYFYVRWIGRSIAWDTMPCCPRCGFSRPHRVSEFVAWMVDNPTAFEGYFWDETCMCARKNPTLAQDFRQVLAPFVKAGPRAARAACAA